MYVLSEAKLFVPKPVFPHAVSSQWGFFFFKRFEVNASQLIDSDVVSSTCMVLCILSTVLPVAQHTVYVRRDY